ncbi:MAG TPA: hypothetical protein VLA16_10885 [Ideonella sp.]|nr:hypothetical protein [Ideonella sp.]
MTTTAADVTLPELKALCDFAAHEALVRDTLGATLAEPVARVRFLARYTNWNGYFGSGVAGFAGKIGRCRSIFLDPAEPVQALADRSVYVASFFFDAARDEFDDRDTVHRDTHRCLAQAALKGFIQAGAAEAAALQDPAQLNALCATPDWLNAVCANVAAGYGVGSPDTAQAVFHSIGYHLGSELLADREFSIIDETLREKAGELVQQLKATRIAIAGQEHVAYQWIAIHSGHGGGAEADHFDWASQGARLAYRFTPPEQHAGLKESLHAGFQAFAADHRKFFTQVNIAA